MKVTFTLTGTTPLLHHNPRMVDPEFELVRRMKALTSKRKKTDEDLEQIKKLEWYGGLYTMSMNGAGKVVISQPTSKVRKCLINAAKVSKSGKMMERALSFAELDVPLIYEGPREIDALFADPRFHSRLSVVVGGKRVMRVRPSFLPWGLSVSGLFLEDAGLNFDDLERIVEAAGLTEGLGDGRNIGYGRFMGKVKQIK